jgi:hypothetical protein
MATPSVNIFKFGPMKNLQASVSHRLGDCLKVPGPSHSLILVRKMSLLSYPFSQPHLSDRDGTVDLVFATCSSVSSSTGVGSGCAINVAYNRQLPLCESSTSPSVVKGKRVCRTPEALCERDKGFKFDLSDRAGNEVHLVLRIRFVKPGLILQ